MYEKKYEASLEQSARLALVPLQRCFCFLVISRKALSCSFRPLGLELPFSC